METNFSFLESKKEYELFAGACIDAECILESFAGYECRGIEKSIGTWGEVGLFD